MAVIVPDFPPMKTTHFLVGLMILTPSRPVEQEWKPMTQKLQTLREVRSNQPFKPSELQAGIVCI